MGLAVTLGFHTSSVASGVVSGLIIGHHPSAPNLMAVAAIRESFYIYYLIKMSQSSDISATLHVLTNYVELCLNNCLNPLKYYWRGQRNV